MGKSRYLASLVGKERVKVVCMDLSSTYRAIGKEPENYRTRVRVLCC
ncbi:hypothetical protein [Legionella pneumophila]|nr:hypothetical protein [Legionella pneumophila]ADG25703.1 hypothetical protein lpa_03379 [Legionella pneumophila 2300/99 Alcoy]HAT6819633.1 hypothetical protein [Legionella pneumophila]HCW6763196.1 hypothetical protein [Legionella pneumophila]